MNDWTAGLIKVRNLSNAVGSLALGSWSSLETVSSAVAIAFSTLLNASASLSVLLPLSSGWRVVREELRIMDV